MMQQTNNTTDAAQESIVARNTSTKIVGGRTETTGLITSTTTGKNTNADLAKEAQRFINAIKPYVPVILAAAAKISTSKTVSSIVSEIRDKFRALSPWGKFFATLGVIAVTAAVGYFSWKIISANWERIMFAIENNQTEIASKFEAMTSDIDDNIYVKQVEKIFEDGIELPKLPLTNPNALTNFIQPFVNGGHDYMALVSEFVSNLKFQ